MIKHRTLFIVVLLVVSLVATGFVWAYKNVHVLVDGQRYDVKTFYSRPEDVLKQLNIQLGPSDEYRMSAPELKNGVTIEVFRAVDVEVNYKGKTTRLVTGKPTVGELAKSLGIPETNVKLIPDKDTRLKSGMNIRAVTLRDEYITERRKIDYEVVKKPDGELEKGLEETETDGEAGIKEVTVKVSYADEEEVAREDVAEKILCQPVMQVIRVGTRDTVMTSRGTMRFRRIANMEATAYYPTDGSQHGLTATGVPARHGIVAVDPDVIPLGTRLYIPGYGLALAADTGGAIVGDKIDLCMEDLDEVWSFGRRYVKVYILAD